MGYWRLARSRGSLSESYGLFYPLIASDDDVRARLHDNLRQKFWSGDIETRHFGAFMYRQVPNDEALKLRSFAYASPGALEVAGVLGCLLMLSRVARAWIKTGDEFLALWEKVEKYFEKRKHLRRPNKQLTLNDAMVLDSDEARTLCFAVGDKLGFDALSCDALIGIIGNPIAALKYLVAAGREGRKLARLQSDNLLKLPEPVGDADVLPAAASRKRGSKVVVVERKRRRLGAKPKA